MSPTKLQRKRKALLVLPLVVVPFLTMAFWAMGGGKAEINDSRATTQGLNLLLPKPELSDDKDKTKLSFYEAAEKVDQKSGGKDGESSFPSEPSIEAGANLSSGNGNGIYDPTPPYSLSQDPNEEKVYQKLAELNRQLSVSPSVTSGTRNDQQGKKMAVETGEVDRLAEMMESVQTKTGPDPELEQLNSMMERIMDIQHPDRVKEKLWQQSRRNHEQVYLVTNVKEEVNASLLGAKNGKDTTAPRNGFFDGQTNPTASLVETNTISAAIWENATVTTGTTVKLQLLSEVFVGGHSLPKGTFVFGSATLEEDRLKITIPSVRYKNNLFAVSLSVYDLDGLEGVHIPGSITRDAAKGSADQTLQSIGLMSMDPSLKSQATAAGIQAAKGLLSKKVKQVRVAIKSGYQVLLKNKNTPE